MSAAKQTHKNLWLAILYWLSSSFVSMLYLCRPRRAGVYLVAELFFFACVFLLDPDQDIFRYILFGFMAVRIFGLLDTIRLIKIQAVNEQWYSTAKGLPLILSLAFFALMLLRVTAYEPVRIPGRSMEPTLLAGDYLIIQKRPGQAGYGRFQFQLAKENAPVYRGQIIIFKYPKDPNQLYIKRVIGLPGDQIYYSNRELIINGHAVLQKKVLAGSSEAGKDFDSHIYEEYLSTVQYHTIDMHKGKEGPHWSLTVPPNQYFVLGDNRSNSHDSREWGMVPINYVLGTPRKIIWSRDERQNIRWKRLGMDLHRAFQFLVP